MKFSWKIFFSTMLITLAIFSAGGYLLIQAFFQASYQREVANAVEENQMLQYSFAAAWNTTVQSTDPLEIQAEQAARAMSEQMSGKALRIRLSDSGKRVLFDSAQAAPDSGLLDGIAPGKRGYMLRQNEEGYELQTASVIRLDQDFLYLESIRDISALFDERNAQYRIYRRWLLWLLLAQSFCCYVLAVWLMRPLRRLSRTTRRIAQGNLKVRANVDSRDELGALAADFNNMADHLEEQFQELNDMARRQEEFIGSFAHELKTPLTSMIGYADMLRSQEMSQEERFQAANYIFKEGRRLEALSLKLLELLVAGHQELKLFKVNARWLAGEIQGVLQPALKRQGLTLKVNVEDEMVSMEPDLMKTVLMNLIDNGRKAMEGQPGFLYLLGLREAKGFSYYVRDTGKGIPEEELKNITDPFYMVDKSRARQQGGAGLGLSICQEIVARHGGLMTFKSAVGKGTVVRVFLPDAPVNTVKEASL
ncbi:MAG: HAMP domain-containing histidine kinase [Lachnospiraceae bacterium]|nr:HAMP domain-containing histidine kinase [Lachnospiraceae bacterium]